jgi:hypothetical protein
MINDLLPGALGILRALEGRVADEYVNESLLPALREGLRTSADRPALARTALLESYPSLRLFYLRYAFVKRGRERRELAESACDALDWVIEHEGLDGLLGAPDARALWAAFSEICAKRCVRNSDQLNRGVVAGIAELAQEIYRQDGEGSIGRWIWRAVVKDRRIEPCFLRMVDVRGVGPKTTAMFLRDVVYVLDLEPRLEHSDRIYIQPIDRWLRCIAGHIAPELRGEHVADWVVAGKLAKYTRRSGVSGIRFNMGASLFGAKVVREPDRLEAALERLITMKDWELEWPPTRAGGRLW